MLRFDDVNDNLLLNDSNIQFMAGTSEQNLEMLYASNYNYDQKDLIAELMDRELKEIYDTAIE